MDSGFHAVDSGFDVCVFRIAHPRIPDSISGWIPDFKILFWIPDSISWIPDSISWIPDSKAVDSRFYRPKLPGFRIPDYLTWGDKILKATKHKGSFDVRGFVRTVCDQPNRAQKISFCTCDEGYSLLEDYDLP